MRPIDADALVAKLDDWRGDIEDVDKNDAHDVAYYSAMSRAIRFAKDAPTLDLAPKWISVKDKKPEDWAHVLVYIRHRHTPDDGYRDVLIKTYSERYGWNMGDNYYEITHWMPLPEAPKEE